MLKNGEPVLPIPENIDLTEDDILEAMKAIPGYLDITPRDFKEIYLLAYRQAVARLSREITAAEIMTRDVVMVKEDTPVAEVAAVMGARSISGVPVIDKNGLVTGVISEKDFIASLGLDGPQNFMNLVATCLTTKSCLAVPLKKQSARNLMTLPAITVQEQTTLKDIAALFVAYRINRVPVVDPAGKLLGIVSRGDIVHTSCQGEKP